MVATSPFILRAKSCLPFFIESLKTPKVLPQQFYARVYSKKSDEKDSCKPDPRCKKKKPSVLQKIKLKVLEGGSNFGTPFRRLKCDPEKKVAVSEPKPKVDPEPEKKKMEPCLDPGVQVSILGVNSKVSQYVALLLKQCPALRGNDAEWFIKVLQGCELRHPITWTEKDVKSKISPDFTSTVRDFPGSLLHLYQAHDPTSCDCPLNLDELLKGLKKINTDCEVEAFRCDCTELRNCLQDTDIVLMMEAASVSMDMLYQERFKCQAPLVKQFTEAIIEMCPEAFVVVNMTPVDCIVPLVAETLKESLVYNPCKLLGSMAVQELRSSYIAAHALSLDPKYVRVPCVGGTEGKSLVPLFSKIVEYFDFTEHDAETLTKAVRNAPSAKILKDGDACTCSAEVGKARALAGLVIKVGHARLCQDTPQVTGFVQTDPNTVICPVRYFANTIELGCTGITKNLGIPKMNAYETQCVNAAMIELNSRWKMVLDWHGKGLGSASRLNSNKFQCLFTPAIDDFGYSFCENI